MASSAYDANQVATSSTDAVNTALGQTNNLMDQLYGVQQANNATNAAMAAEQRDWSAQQAELTRRYNSAEAAANRDWQQMMSNTAHQREVSDLVAAGLNPILSATGGNGAAVTSGSAASAANPSGSSAQGDNSLNQAIVSLLGNNLSAMTKLADMSTSALTADKTADKYTAATELAALISADASKYGANQSSAAARYSADQHAAATRDAAVTHAKATEYAADSSARATRYASTQSADATRYSADRHAAATRYSADASRYATDTQRDLYINYPNNIQSALLRAGDALEDGLGADSMTGVLRNLGSLILGLLK